VQVRTRAGIDDVAPPPWAQADAFFPPIDPAIWQETACETHAADDANRYPMCFCRYERRR